MTQLLPNLAQIIYQSPLVGELYIGQLTAAEEAKKHAQEARAKALARKAETVSQAEESASAFALESNKARPQAPQKKAKPKAQAARKPVDEKQVVDISV